MVLDEKSPLSLYYQIKNIILDNIKNKVWETNSRIPTERELCNIYKVSRITVRQALKELENEGYLYRKQGKGTFVTGQHFVQRLTQFYSFSEEIKKMGSVPSTRILSYQVLPAGPGIAEKLQIAEGDPVYEIRRLRLADEEPFALELSYVVQKHNRNLTQEAVRANGLYNALRETKGLVPNEAVETFEAVNTNADEAEALQVNKRTAALHLERVASADGMPVEYCISVIRSDKYKYTVHLGKSGPV